MGRCSQIEVCVVGEEYHISHSRCARASLRLRSPDRHTAGGEPRVAGRVAQALRGVHQADYGLELLQRFDT